MSEVSTRATRSPTNHFLAHSWGYIQR